jgi:glycine dehydrogenase subunit 1
MTMLGKQGLKEVAMLSLNKAHYLYDQLIKTEKFKPVFTAPFFCEFAVSACSSINDLNAKLLEDGIIGGLDLSKEYSEIENGWLLAVTEKRTRQEIDSLVSKAVSYCD